MLYTKASTYSGIAHLLSSDLQKLPSFTLEAWIYIFEDKNSTLYGLEGENRSFTLTYTMSGVEAGVGVLIYKSGETYFSGSMEMGALSSWKHIACVLGRESKYIYPRMYQGGKLQQETERLQSAEGPPLKYLLVGQSRRMEGEGALGFKHFRLWGYPRTGTQIYNSMYMGMGEGVHGLLCYYSFGDGVGDPGFITDESGQGNHMKRSVYPMYYATTRSRDPSDISGPLSTTPHSLYIPALPLCTSPAFFHRSLGECRGLLGVGIHNHSMSTLQVGPGHPLTLPLTLLGVNIESEYTLEIWVMVQDFIISATHPTTLLQHISPHQGIYIALRSPVVFLLAFKSNNSNSLSVNGELHQWVHLGVRADIRSFTTTLTVNGVLNIPVLLGENHFPTDSDLLIGGGNGLTLRVKDIRLWKSYRTLRDIRKYMYM